MEIRPLHDRVIIKREVEQEVKKGGIIIPDTAKEKPQQGIVLAVGEGKTTDDGRRIAPEVKKDDKVLFGKYSGTEYKTEEGEELVILREDDILAIME